MRLYERKGVYWADIRQDGYRFRFSTKETSKPEAKKAALKMLVGKISASETKVLKQTKKETSYPLSKLFERLMDTRYRDSDYVSSINAHNAAVMEFFGANKDIRSITQQEIAKFREYILTRKDYKSASTRNKKILALSSLMKIAREDWGIEGVPKLVMKTERVKTMRKFIFTDDDIELILTYYKSRGEDFMHDLILYLSQTGQRLGEALRLSEEDIRMDTGVVDVWVSKGDEPRGIPMTAKVREMLARRTDFRELKTYQVENRWRRMRAELKLPEEATMHGLRHTFATRMCEKGADIQTVQRLLGHKQLTTTTIYAKMTSKRLTDAMKLFEAE